MDDHKPVMIIIFSYFQNMRKMQFFYENILGKFLGFGLIHEYNLNFLKKISEKTRYFNTEFVFYSVNIQPDIMQN
jgi:hypothetical protein